LDLEKYRALFLEEATEYLAEMSRSLLDLEKDAAAGEAIETVFRAAHSIKSMASSLEYVSIAELAHRLEDRMESVRADGRVGSADDLVLLFRGLEGLEGMVTAVRKTGEPPPGDLELLAALDPATSHSGDPPPKKAPESGGEAPPARPTASSSPSGADTPNAPSPPPSVRVRTDNLDRFLSSVGEVILSSSQLRTAAAGGGLPARPAISEGFDRMERVVGELQRRALALRTTPLLRVVEMLPRVAREVGRRAGKRVEMEIEGAELELDRAILDRLADPLAHLVRNAVDHGIETPEERRAAGKPEAGRIEIAARRVKDSIRITVSDDGRGIDLDAVRERAVAAGLLHPDLAEDLPPEELVAFVFKSGLSTAEAVSDVSGRGVGMDVVKNTIEALGGHLEIATERGRGTTTALLVPITAAVQRVLLVQSGEETVAIPIAKVDRLMEVGAEEIEQAGSEAFVLVDDEPLLVLDLAACLVWSAPPDRCERGDARPAGGAAG
jgi:two-component system chemotaxis sensor kinase CheA